MKFKQYDDGSCDIEFSWKERFILLKRGKLHLSDDNLKHFGNYLVKIVSDWQLKFNEKTKKLHTEKNTKIISK
jgi:hypothetical protein